MEIAAFDFYDFGDIIHELFKILPTNPIDANFDSIGFESQYFMVNIGTMIVFYLIYTLALVLSVSLHRCATKEHKRVRSCSRGLDRRIYWGTAITLMTETYQIVTVCVLINMKILNFDTVGMAVMSAFCIIFLVLSILLPVFFLCKVGLNFEEIQEKRYRLTNAPPGSVH